MPVFDSIFFTGTEWFVRDCDIYVSSLGDEVTANGAPLQPYGSIQQAISMAAPGDKIVVGNGLYNEELDGLGKNVQLICDSEAILKSSIPTAIAFSNMGASATINGFRIENYQKAIEGTIDTLENCIIVNTSLDNFGGLIKGCILKTVTLNASANTNLFNNTFIQVTAGTAASGNNKFIDIYDCHFAPDSIWEITSGITQNFDYCNQQTPSQIKVDGVTYASAAALHAAFPQYQIKGKTVSPLFNAPLAMDYSISESSLLRNAGRFNRHIGAIGTGLHSNRQSLRSGMRLENVVVDSLGRFTLGDDFDEGTITTPVINLGKLRTLGIIKLFAEQTYEFPPENAVVDIKNDNRAPNALSFQMRYGNVESQVKRGAYKGFIWNRIPTVDAMGKGNGDEEFDFDEQQFISTQYVQLIITMRRSEETSFLVQENSDCLLQENGSNIIWKY